MHDAVVEITQSGRGGSIHYRESENRITFDWEFAVSPAIALIFGPPSRFWDQRYPWAHGRQAEIAAFVGAEIIRQKAPGAACEIDLATGDMTIVKRPQRDRVLPPIGSGRISAGTKRTPAYERFVAGIVPALEHWPDGHTYDLAAIPDMSVAERHLLVDRLTGRDLTWREVEALGAIDTPAARTAVKAALQDHLSIDTRVTAAVVLHLQGRMADLDAFLARQIRNLDRPANGLGRLLRVAADYPSDRVKQALLWASSNCTECAPHCAALLLKLSGAAAEPFDERVLRMLGKLDRHNSYFDREAAFGMLRGLVGMALDPDASD